MPNRLQLKLESEGSFYTLPINPIEFTGDHKRQYLRKENVEGGSVEQFPIFDSKPRTLTWRNLPNKSPYNTMVTQLESYVGAGTVVLKLRDLSGTVNSSVEQNIRVLAVDWDWSSKASATSDASLIYDTIQLLYVPLRIVS